LSAFSKCAKKRGARLKSGSGRFEGGAELPGRSAGMPLENPVKPGKTAETAAKGRFTNRQLRLGQQLLRLFHPLPEEILREGFTGGAVKNTAKVLKAQMNCPSRMAAAHIVQQMFCDIFFGFGDTGRFVRAG
jgi:hypothetical protein